MVDKPSPQPGISPTEAPALSAADRKVLRAAKILSIKWTTAGQKVDGDDFYEAINDIHEAVCAAYGVDPIKGFRMTTSEPSATLTAKTSAPGISTERVEEIRGYITGRMRERGQLVQSVAVELLAHIDAQAAKLAALTVKVEPGELAEHIAFLRERAEYFSRGGGWSDPVDPALTWFTKSAGMLESLAREREPNWRGRLSDCAIKLRS